MHRVGKDLLFRSGFYHTAEIHNADVIAYMFNDRQVVRNEHIRKTEVRLQILQQVDDLCLNGNVQCADRFVTDDETGFKRQSTSNTYTLTLTAAELMGITFKVMRLQTALFHDVENIILILFLRNDIVYSDCFADDFTDGHTRRQTAVRVLEDDLNLRT